jgi:hypothetical protein
MSRAQEETLSAQSIVVTVSDEMLAEIHQVADDLAARGMEVHRVMPITGVITGAYDPAQVSSLQRVKGVLSVENEAVARLPQFGSSVQ